MPGDEENSPHRATVKGKVEEWVSRGKAAFRRNPPDDRKREIGKYLKMPSDKLLAKAQELVAERRAQDPEGYEIRDAVSDQLLTFRDVFHNPILQEGMAALNEHYQISESVPWVGRPAEINDRLFALFQQHQRVDNYARIYDEFAAAQSELLEERLRSTRALLRHQSVIPPAGELIKKLIDEESYGIQFGQYIGREISRAQAQIEQLGEDKKGREYMQSEDRLRKIRNAEAVFQEKFPQYSKHPPPPSRPEQAIS